MNSSLLLFLLLLCSFSCLIVCYQQQQRSSLFSTNVSKVKNNEDKNKNSKQKNSRQTELNSQQTILDATKVLNNIRDELYDSFDAIVYAESNTERLGHIVDIVDRNKKIIGGIGAFYFIKNRIFSKKASKIAFDLIKEQRNNEMKKWGARI